MSRRFLGVVVLVLTSASLAIAGGEPVTLRFESSSLPAGICPATVVAPDFDEDGHLDILITNHHSHDLTLLSGDGTGRFTELDAIPVPGADIPHPLSIAMGDFNGDGHLDGATVSFLNNEFLVFLGDGAGHFEVGQRMPTESFALRIAAAHIDEDESLDLAWVNRDSNSVQVVFGAGDGTFSTPARYTVGMNPTAIQLADVDADGHQDVISADSRGKTVTVLYGDGTGGFPESETIEGFGVVSFVGTADVDADGVIEMVVSHDEGLSVVQSSRAPPGEEGGGADEAGHGVGSGAITLTIVDIDENGTLDVIAPDWEEDELRILSGDGAGHFDLVAVVPVGDGPWGTVAADLDADGHLDIVVTNESGGDAVLLRNASFDLVEFRRGDANGDGNIDISDPVETLNYLFLGGARPGCLDAADTNGDGAVGLSDAIFELAFLFVEGDAPPPPFEECGDASELGAIGCEESTSGC